MKVNQMDTTKEAVKTYLELAAGKINEVNKDAKVQWFSQVSHKAAAGMFAMDIVGMTDEKERNAFMAQWMATPSGFAANASQLNKDLGHEGTKAKTAKVFAGF